MVPVSNPDRDLGNVKVKCPFCLHSVTLGSTQLVKEISTVPRSFVGRKVRPARGAEQSAVLIVPDVSKDGSSTFNLLAKSS